FRAAYSIIRAKNAMAVAVNHVERDIENDEKTDPGDPRITLEELSDVGRGDGHQYDGDAEADDEYKRRFTCRTGHRQHIVERHRKVGENDGPERRPERRLLRMRQRRGQ